MTTISQTNPYPKIPSFVDPAALSGTAYVPPRPFSPQLLAEIHYDTYDVRSQIKLTGDVCVAFPLIQLDEDTLWTVDMMRRIDRSRLVPTPAEGICFEVPAMEIDRAYLTCRIGEAFSRHFTTGVFHHPELRIFSSPHESREEYAARCRAASREAATEAWIALRKKYQRDLDGIRERYHLRPVVSTEEASFQHLEENHRRMIGEAYDSLTRLFFTFGEIPPSIKPQLDICTQDDVKYAVSELIANACRELQRLYAELESRLERIEFFPIKVKRSDVTVYQFSLLWVPAAENDEIPAPTP